MDKSNRVFILVFIALWVSFNSLAQVNRYVVFLSDKTNTPYSLDMPNAFLSERAVQRRTNQGIELTESDLPVDPAYVSGVTGTGADVLFASKWLNALIIQSSAGLVPTIEGLAYVTGVELIAPGEKPASGSRKSRRAAGQRSLASVNIQQFNQLGLNNLHGEGYRGNGVRMAFFDSGFRGVDTTDPFAHIFDDNRLVYTYNIVEGHREVYISDDHGTEAFSTVSAFDPGYTGAAYEAEFMLFLTEHVGSEYRIEEYNWLVAAEMADSAGTDIISASLGYNTFDDTSMNYQLDEMDGNTAVVTRAADLAAEKGILVVTSAGNEANDPNWGTIIAPADADSVVSVGMVDSNGNLGSSSSRGPSADGRIKPEVVALGVRTSVIRDNGTPGTSTGTSFSAPLVAGFAACLWQLRPSFTNMQLRDTILSLGNRSDSPDNQFGYGIPQYGTIITSIEDLDGAEGIKLYPNPLQGDILIITSDEQDLARVNIHLMDTKGGEVKEWRYDYLRSGNRVEVDTCHMRQGVYLLELEFDSFSSHFKIIKY